MIQRAHSKSIVVPVAMMAAATGARTMAGLAAATRSGSADLSRATTALAALELAADKLPGIPSRVDPMALAGRVVAGALLGAAVARRTGHDRVTAAAVGAISAYVGAHISFRLRRRLIRRLPRVAAALVEDFAVLALARRGARSLGGRI